MSWQSTPFALTLVLPVLFGIGLGWYVAVVERDRDSGLRYPFLAMVGFASLWSAAYALQLGSTALVVKLFWNRFVWIGIAGMAVAWPLFALAYCGYRDWLRPERIGLIAAVPGATVLLVWAGGTVPLLYTTVELTTVGGTTVLGPTPGPVLLGFLLYSYCVNAITFALLGHVAWQRRGPHRRQALLLLVAGVLPMAVGIAGFLGVGGLAPIDLTPVAFVVTSLLITWALFGYRLFDLAPIARETVFAELADAVILLDEGGTVIDANDTARDLFGGETLLGTSAETAFTAYPTIRRAIEDQGSVDSNNVTIEADGRVRVFAVTTSTIGSGEFGGVVVFLRDVTDREVLQRRFKTLIEKSPNVISVVASDGSFTYVSPSVERLLGYSPTDLEGSDPVSYVHPDDREAMASAIRTALETEDVVTLEHRTRHADGSWRRFETVVERLFSGTTSEVVLTWTDITESRQYEQRLQVLNRVLRHDLKNDVNVISGYVDLLREVVDDPAAEPYLDVIERRAFALTHLGDQAREIDVVLHTDTDRESVDLSSLVTEVTERFAPDHPHAEVSYVVPDTAFVVADPLVSSAFENVLENAVLHHDGSTPTVHVAVEPTENGYAIVVSDDGPGIPATERDVLATGQETPLEHASGLGLWLVHWIVTESGGKLAIEGDEPHGTTVRMSFATAETDD